MTNIGAGQKLHPGRDHGHGDQGAGRALHPASSTTDPVCAMEVDPAGAAGGSAEHDSVTYWFCSPECREEFGADPRRYVSTVPPTETRAMGPGGDDRIYTCPMLLSPIIASAAMSLSSVSVIANSLRLRRVPL